MSKTIPGRQRKQFIVEPKGFVICQSSFIRDRKKFSTTQKIHQRLIGRHKKVRAQKRNNEVLSSVRQSA